MPMTCRWHYKRTPNTTQYITVNYWPWHPITWPIKHSFL